MYAGRWLDEACVREGVGDLTSSGFEPPPSNKHTHAPNLHTLPASSPSSFDTSSSLLMVARGRSVLVARLSLMWLFLSLAVSSTLVTWHQDRGGIAIHN